MKTGGERSGDAWEVWEAEAMRRIFGTGRCRIAKSRIARQMVQRQRKRRNRQLWKQKLLKGEMKA